jgi:hypothetical protein
MLKNKFIFIFSLTLTSLILTSCGVSKQDYEKITLEYEQLKEENESIKSQLDELENGAGRLLEKMSVAFNDNKYTQVKSTFQNLKDRHFDSEQFKEGQKIYDQVIEYEKLEEEKRKQEQEEKKLEEERLKQEKLASLNKLTKKHDDVSGFTFYFQPYFEHYTNTNLTSIYIAKQDSSIWLNLRMSYKGKNWIFFENAYLSYEGNTIAIPFNRFEDKDSDNGGGSVWEYLDAAVTDDILIFLRKFAYSTDAKMRLSGKYTETRTLTWNERQGIIDVLNGYDALKNEI